MEEPTLPLRGGKQAGHGDAPPRPRRLDSGHPAPHGTTVFIVWAEANSRFAITAGVDATSQHKRSRLRFG